MGSSRSHFPGIEERPDALRPQAVVGAVPAEPAAEADIEHARGVAVHLLEPDAARPAVLEAAEGHVAGRAQHRARAREARLEEQALAERGRLGLPRDAVARIARELRRPGAVTENSG